MSLELGKTYDPAAIEKPIYEMWLRERCFAADPAGPGEPYCIVIPPPNVTGALHLGHAINNTLQDILTRNHRMRGFNALWIPGIDHAGIATQAVVEKQLKEKENKTRHDVGREGLVQRIWEWKEQYGNRIIEQLKRMGCSCDWDRQVFTLDEGPARAVRETFFKLFKDGLIYRGKRLVNWDTHLQTSISDDEIYHEAVKTSLWHIRYPIVEEEAPHVHAGLRATHVVVATTRPETMLGDTAVAVHSEDPRWNWAIGKMVELPLTGRQIPIIADDILVDPKFGTGVVKVTPAHDPNDYATWQRHQGKPDQIDLINILNPDGTINENGGKYAKMKRDAARKKVVEDLTAQGLLEKEEPYETQVGHSDRSKTPIEPYLSDQWYVHTGDDKPIKLAQPALDVVREGVIKFFPERHAQQYLSWLGEKRDWPISRQLWWGHRIPVWSKTSQRDFNRDPSAVPETESWREQDFNDKLRKDLQDTFCTQRMGDGTTGTVITFACVKPGYPNTERELEASGYVQDPDVLDTWFSSGLWPHSTLGWPTDTPALRKWYPTSVLLTGRDIVTLWVARMVMLGMYNMGDSSRLAATQRGARPDALPSGSRLNGDGRTLGIPFHHVAINPTILDGKGERMSKSKGNGVDPVDVIETHGADALRFTLALMATETQDVRMPVKKNADGRNTSEKFDIGSRFCNKIWQVGLHFVIPNLQKIPAEPVDESRWSLADRWIVSRFNRTVRIADETIETYRFDQYAKACYDFVYGDFCDWYVEAAKPALKDGSTAGQTANVLAAVLDGSLRLLHPVIPFITEAIWEKLCEARPNRGLSMRLHSSESKRLILANWPGQLQLDDEAENKFAAIRETSTNVRNARTELKIGPKVRLDLQYVESPTFDQDARGLVEYFTVSTMTPIAGSIPPGVTHIPSTMTEIIHQGWIDSNLSQDRDEKRRAELNKTISMLTGRLSNESYTARAPAHLVQQTRDQLAQAEAELSKLG